MLEDSSSTFSGISDSAIFVEEDIVDQDDSLGHQVFDWTSAGLAEEARIRLSELIATESLDRGVGRSLVAVCPSRNMEAKDTVDLPEGCNLADMVDMIENLDAVEGIRL